MEGVGTEAAQRQLGSSSAPSGISAVRLAGSLEPEAADYRNRLDLDLDAVDALEGAGAHEAAAAILSAHIDALVTFAGSVERALADAVVEREAESVMARAVALLRDEAAQGAPLPHGFAPLLQPTPPPPARWLEGEAAAQDPLEALREPVAAGISDRRGTLARVGLAVALAALVAVIALPSVQQPVDPTLAAAAQATEAQLELAEAQLQRLRAGGDLADVVASSRGLHDTILALPAAELARPVVRERVRALLMAEAGALLRLAPSATIDELLAEVRAISEALNLDLGPLGSLLGDLDLPAASAPQQPAPASAGGAAADEPQARPRPAPAPARPDDPDASSGDASADPGDDPSPPVRDEPSADDEPSEPAPPPRGPEQPAALPPLPSQVPIALDAENPPTPPPPPGG